MKKANWQLVLMIDGFDVLLHHPILNRADIFRRFAYAGLAVSVCVGVVSITKG
jgi:hypothetical protein